MSKVTGPSAPFDPSVYVKGLNFPNAAEIDAAIAGLNDMSDVRSFLKRLTKLVYFHLKEGKS